MTATNDPTMEAIGIAVALGQHGHTDAARHTLLDLWQQIGVAGDPFHRCTLAHSLADLYDNPAEALIWDVRALDAADALTNERAQQHHASLHVAGFYPSLHLNIADNLRRLAAFDTAATYIHDAERGAGELPENPYGNLIRAAIGEVGQAIDHQDTSRRASAPGAAQGARGHSGHPRSSGNHQARRHLGKESDPRHKRKELNVPKLFYVMNMSLDGFIEDKDGGVAFFPIDDAVFNDQIQMLASTGTFLYGRRLYDTMAVWETDPALAEASPMMADFASTWQAAEKIVYSTSLEEPSTDRTRIERAFAPDTVHDLKSTATSDITIGGPDLAGQAFEAGLVDEIRMYVVPTILGRGKPGLPVAMNSQLELIDEHRFGNGVMRLTYRPVPA